MKDECLSRLIFFGRSSVERALKAYVEHYHTERNHQGIGNVILLPRPEDRVGSVTGRVVRRTSLGGLLSFYARRVGWSTWTIRGSDGTYAFTYGTNGSYTDNSGYDTAWCSSVVIQRPDSTNNGFVTQYFDETAQPLGRVLTDSDPSGSPTKTWAEKVTRDANGPARRTSTRQRT